MAVSKKTLHLNNVHKPNPVNCSKKYFEKIQCFYEGDNSEGNYLGTFENIQKEI